MEKEPNDVLNLREKLKNKKIWFIISNNYNNQEAQGCWDAALKRNRLGHSNIPIFCELKSILGFVIKDNKKKYVIVHCRGNQEIDKEKVNKIIGAKCQKIKNKTELKNLGLGFGLINPFLGFDRPDILQIFDESLLTQNFIPYTMMTNASHSRWGVEFKLDELIDSLPNKLIEDILLENTKFEIKKHKIGILTGNSPESGMLLWEKINMRIRDNLGDDHFLGDISFPGVIIESIPEMGMSMDLGKRREEVEEVVNRGITNLCERGATIVCIACNTTQYFSEMSKEICSKHNKHEVIYVSIPEITYQYLKKAFLFSLKPKNYRRHLTDGPVNDELRKAFKDQKHALTSNAKLFYKSDTSWEIQDQQKIFHLEDMCQKLNIYKEIKEFDFLGIDYASDFEKWSAFKNLNSGFDLNLPKEKDIKKINELAFEVKKKGAVSGGGIKDLVRLIDESTKTDTIILALTELSIIFKSHKKSIIKKSKKMYLDTLTILAEAIGDMCTKDCLSAIEKPEKIRD